MTSEFYALIKPTRQNFLIDQREEEMKIMEEHFLYLKNIHEQGKLLLAGPTLVEEDPTGIYVLQNVTEEEAREIMANDPSIRKEVQKIVEFRPFRASLVGKK